MQNPVLNPTWLLILNWSWNWHQKSKWGMPILWCCLGQLFLERIRRKSHRKTKLRQKSHRRRKLRLRALWAFECFQAWNNTERFSRRSRFWMSLQPGGLCDCLWSRCLPGEASIRSRPHSQCNAWFSCTCWSTTTVCYSWQRTKLALLTKPSCLCTAMHLALKTREK